MFFMFLLLAAKLAQRKTMDENTTLRTQIRRLAKVLLTSYWFGFHFFRPKCTLRFAVLIQEFQNSEREVYEQKVASLTAELNAYVTKTAIIW